MIDSIRYRNRPRSSARKYRTADVLLIDDIQFIAGQGVARRKSSSTPSTRCTRRAADRALAATARRRRSCTLEDRLRSRFEWGLIADIQPPDLETRMAILRAKADMLGRHGAGRRDRRSSRSRCRATSASSRAASIACWPSRSFRRSRSPIDYGARPPWPVSPRTAAQRRVGRGRRARGRRASTTRVAIEDLRGKQRDKHIVVPRQIAMYLMREETEASLPGDRPGAGRPRPQHGDARLR